MARKFRYVGPYPDREMPDGTVAAVILGDGRRCAVGDALDFDGTAADQAAESTDWEPVEETPTKKTTSSKAAKEDDDR